MYPPTHKKMSILEQKSKRTQLLFVFLISQIILVSYVLPLITAILILTEESTIGDVFWEKSNDDWLCNLHLPDFKPRVTNSDTQ